MIKKITLGLILASALISNTTVIASKVLPTQEEKITRVVKNFNAIAAGGPIQVIVTLGTQEGLVFEGDKEAIGSLVTEVKGTALIIRPQMSWTSWSHKYKGKKIIARVKAINLGSLTMSGDGSIVVNGTIRQEALVVTLSGSGSVKADVDVDNFKAVMSGSGVANITGNAENTNAVISGSGVLASKEKPFDGGNISARISGSGKVYVQTDEVINALISGSGSVYYSGNPEVSEKKILGTGGVKPL
jgi:hypothetical protein